MFIYKITNKINGKIYIGQTIQKNPWRRIQRHFLEKEYRGVCLIKRAIKKYGKNNFVVEIIYTAINLEDLNQKEQYYIFHFNSLNPNGYNIKSGGKNGGKLPQYVIEKIRQKNTGRPSTLKGKKFSKAHKEALSRARKGKSRTKNQLEAQKKYYLENGRKVVAINIKTNEQFIFPTTAEAAKILKCQAANISRVCNKEQNRSQHKGWRFHFLDDLNFEPIVHEPTRYYIKNKHNMYAIKIGKIYLGSYPTAELAEKMIKLYLQDINLFKNEFNNLYMNKTIMCWKKFYDKIMNL